MPTHSLNDTQLAELQILMDKTKIALMSKTDSAFFTTIAFSLRQVWDETERTAYTDSVVMGWNPDFFKKLSPEERLFVMVHEACHVAYDHMGRLMGREHEMWNIACDHVINLMLLERGFKMPDWVCKDPRFTGMSADEVYTILQNEKTPPPPNQMPDMRPWHQSSTNAMWKT
jgi:predicted metal-dependent peptidase